MLETLRAYLRKKSVLLILDNCEHVIEQAAIVAEALLDGCPRVRIMATSRERFRAAGERAYRLHPLSANDAVILFADRASAVDHRFVVTTENAPEIERICQNVDGMPLAIELAAARVNVFSVKALAIKLDDRLSILSGGERTADPRLQTMRATIDWSYGLLSGPEQRVFERLSIFAGSCTLGSATAVCAIESQLAFSTYTTYWRHLSRSPWSWRISKDPSPDIDSSNYSASMHTKDSSLGAKISSSLAVTLLPISTLPNAGRAASRSTDRNVVWGQALR